jgi:hypothetical protein
MTENLGMGQLPEEAKEQMAPHWISPIVTWLASPEAKNVTGRMFDVSGRALSISEGWHRGPTATPVDDPTKMGEVVAELMSKARLNADMGGNDAEGPGRPGKGI